MNSKAYASVALIAAIVTMTTKVYAANEGKASTPERAPLVNKAIDIVKPVVDVYNRVTTYETKLTGPITVTPTVDRNFNVNGVSITTSSPDNWNYGKKGK